MDDKVRAGLQRWLEAEAAARDDEADDAFGSVFRAVGDEQPASAAFAADTPPEEIREQDLPEDTR